MIFEEYSNASAVKADTIPQGVINGIAEILYNILARTDEESDAEHERRAVNEG